MGPWIAHPNGTRHRIRNCSRSDTQLFGGLPKERVAVRVRRVYRISRMSRCGLHGLPGEQGGGVGGLVERKNNGGVETMNGLS